ncbi:DUF3800 domain-containing protein [Legionella gresilensis]|uniref:DUF3800 domain-containing protein n=1 Tax=Legionella gresilensis TaxID=91823 RepID=UPI001040FBF7|nr:DUF3800 domain-containing protein [Legionella gresilensis]
MEDFNFSEFIVYIDESGDHSLESIDKDFPVFVLAFCIFRKNEYSQTIIPKLQAFKFKYFGHNMVVLHERKIKKSLEEFRILTNERIRNTFFYDLNKIIDEAEFSIISSAIRKDLLKGQYTDPENPYSLALVFNLERLYKFLAPFQQQNKTTHLIFESRGKKEDNDLELVFRRACDGNNYLRQKLPFEIVFADKKANSCGLQFADLVARPIGRKIITPSQQNRAFDILEKKLHRVGGDYRGFGLKCFP